MSEKKYKYYMAIAFVTVFVISGCAGLQNYGKVRYGSATGEMINAELLEKDWANYYVYYHGASIENPAAIIFDPKNDDKTLVSDYWERVEDQETVSYVMTRLQRYVRYNSRVYSILGPDDQFYGYVVFPQWRWSWGRSGRYADEHLVVKAIDDKTLYVYDVDSPHSSDGII